MNSINDKYWLSEVQSIIDDKKFRNNPHHLIIYWLILVQLQLLEHLISIFRNYLRHESIPTLILEGLS